jgi:3-hydroxyacyl-CoA dehydrogenase/enoyl-CoA hydratase/3-hydroxybutyryl-CoA epimerase
MAPEEIVRRTVGPMLEEAQRCLAEGIIRSTRDGDVGAVFGIGFPAWRGGPFRYLAATGTALAPRHL